MIIVVTPLCIPTKKANITVDPCPYGHHTRRSLNSGRLNHQRKEHQIDVLNPPLESVLPLIILILLLIIFPLLTHGYFLFLGLGFGFLTVPPGVVLTIS